MEAFRRCRQASGRPSRHVRDDGCGLSAALNFADWAANEKVSKRLTHPRLRWYPSCGRIVRRPWCAIESPLRNADHRKTSDPLVSLTNGVASLRSDIPDSPAVRNGTAPKRALCNLACRRDRHIAGLGRRFPFQNDGSDSPHHACAHVGRNPSANEYSVQKECRLAPVKASARSGRFRDVEATRERSIR